VRAIEITTAHLCSVLVIRQTYSTYSVLQLKAWNCGAVFQFIQNKSALTSNSLSRC